jgi:hypothetical protein
VDFLLYNLLHKIMRRTVRLSMCRYVRASKTGRPARTIGLRPSPDTVAGAGLDVPWLRPVRSLSDGPAHYINANSIFPISRLHIPRRGARPPNHNNRRSPPILQPPPTHSIHPRPFLSAEIEDPPPIYSSTNHFASCPSQGRRRGE